MERQAVLCIINNNAFAIDLKNVREIVRMSEITPLPESPPWVLGVTRLRDEVIPLLDGEAILKTGRSEIPLKEKKIAVLHTGEQRYAGLVVDEIDEVYKFNEKDSQELELPGLGISAEVIKRDQELFALINIETITKRLEGTF